MKLHNQSLERMLHEIRVSLPTDAASTPQAAEWSGPAPASSDRETQSSDVAGEAEEKRLADFDELPSTGSGSELVANSRVAPRGETGNEAVPGLPSPPHDRLNSTDLDCLKNASVLGETTQRDAEQHEPESLPAKAKDYQPRIADRVRPLSQAQLAAIELIVLGHADPSVANQLGIHRRTVFNWRHHNPAFRAELARRRDQVWGAAGDQFRAGLQRAIEILLKQVNDVYAPTAFRAARAMLSLAGKFKPAQEPVDVEDVLTLEARNLKVQKHELHPSKSLVYEDERQEALEFLMRRAGENFTSDEKPAQDAPDVSD